ncbi:hypothetical protein K2Z84_23440 [Candidatus Binatia bacterium]|nr:hypothetical protein [Candidatus Binatia bacterium]
MCSSLRTLLLVASLVAALPTGARADGELDPSFATTGVALVDLGGSDENVAAAAVASDGRIVIVGDMAGTKDRDLVVAALKPGGAPDTSFAGTGLTTADFGGVEQAKGVAIDVDGSIAALGTRRKDGKAELVLTLYRADGTLDSTFNGTGRRVLAFSDSADNDGAGVAFDLHGRIVVAGTRTTGAGSVLAIGRLLRDGSLDTSFNGNGKRFVDFGIANGVSVTGAAVAIADDGKIVIAGTRAGASGTDFAIARVDGAGALDTAFNGSGKVSVDFGGNDVARALALRPDGGIAVAGSRITASGSDFAVALRLADGKADPAFRGNGKATTDFGANETAFAIAAQADGKLVAAGVRDGTNGRDFAIARYLLDGTADPALDGDGKVRLDLSAGGTDEAAAIVVQADGRLLVAGSAVSDGRRDAAVLRLLSPLATAVGTLEIPAPGSRQSGIGVISGWLCSGPSVSARLDGQPAMVTAYGTGRADTTTICGDANNGFGLLFNWGLLGDGSHVIRMFSGNAQFASARFTVSTLGVPFLRGASGRYSLPGFPQAGSSIDVVWSEALQRFAIAQYTRPTTATAASGSAGAAVESTSASTVGTLENPAPGSLQSGIGVISGWACDATSIQVRIDDRPAGQAAYGTGRADTQPICGDSNNGFGMLINWGLLGDGTHTVEIRAGGVTLASSTFAVTTLGTPFLRGAAASYTLPDFPESGRNVDIAWDEGQQNFIVVGAD